ncbi:MAG: CCA tRNA nucleotidyltransferase, partial [Alphaproteobacteria bacterium]
MKPAEKMRPKAWMGSAAVRLVMDALNMNGTAARFVGGCVRDMLLDRDVKDVDIATPLHPSDVMQRLDSVGVRTIPTGIDHGTVTAVVDDDSCPFSHFEITTLRADVTTDGRRATVAFVDDWAVDAARRDFTINALFCDMDGTVYDPVGGLEDLRARRVRFVGDPSQRIGEDVLRLLRFFRFQAA